MPKYKPSIPFEDCYGSVGDLTFYHRDGKCYYRKRSSPEFPGTMLQMEHQTVHLRALEAWRQLTPELQKQWNDYSVGVQSHRPPFDGHSGITGHNLFVSAYHGFAQLGREHSPLPQRWESFPDYFLDWESLQVLDGKDILLRFFCSVGDGTVGHRYRLLLKLELTRPGHGRRPGLQRNFLAESDCTDEDGRVCFRVPDFKETWQLDLPEYTAHCRFILIDNLTGYRSRFRMQSFRFSL